MRKRRPLLAAVILLGSLSYSCAVFRPATVPIPTLELLRNEEPQCLVILLPGRNSSPESFARAGFDEAVRKRNLPIDLIAADAHLGYYRSRSVLERIREDIIEPARREGYDEFWIAGTSLGGLGALLYLRDHPEDLSGIVAIAPFLGDESVIDEVAGAGGPQNWTPPAESEGVGYELWSWLATADLARSDVSVYLGWGTEDDFDRSNRLLASMLPAGHVFTTEGGHDPETWLRIWESFLDEARPCADPR